MKQIIVLCIFSITSIHIINAQVGINTTSPSPDSALDIDSDDKGILIPRVDITDLSTIAPITGGSTEGLLVYNTNTTTGKGFYYWEGSQWQIIGEAGWGLSGNAGTNTTTDFLGTTDATNLIVKTNDATALTVGSTGNIGMLNVIGLARLYINENGTNKNAMYIENSNTSNTYGVAQFVNKGSGGVIYARSTNNAITGVISVGDFSYQGGDVDDHIGVEGSSRPAAGWGIGVLGTGNYYGVYSDGDFGASGTKTFIADHPLEPDTKLLRHFCIESNEVTNMYRGTIVLDSNGRAVVHLPDYFEKINTNVSYQLTAIGTPTQPYVAKEILDNQFTVAGAPNTKVSWTVYAERNDAYMQLHPKSKKAVIEKKGSRKGKYITPTFYGKSNKQKMFD